MPGGDDSLVALDIGLGMKPDLTGNGCGKQFFTEILDFANRKFAPDTIRLTDADVNERALHLYSSISFSDFDCFLHEESETPFTLLTKDM